MLDSIARAYIDAAPRLMQSDQVTDEEMAAYFREAGSAMDRLLDGIFPGRLGDRI